MGRYTFKVSMRQKFELVQSRTTVEGIDVRKIWTTVREFSGFSSFWSNPDREMPTMYRSPRGRQYAMPSWWRVIVQDPPSAHVLIHEFLHCTMGRDSKSRQWHSPRFKATEWRINEALGLPSPWWLTHDRRKSKAALPTLKGLSTSPTEPQGSSEEPQL
jgi:hypothetical protein